MHSAAVCTHVFLSANASPGNTQCATVLPAFCELSICETQKLVLYFGSFLSVRESLPRKSGVRLHVPEVIDTTGQSCPGLLPAMLW